MARRLVLRQLLTSDHPPARARLGQSSGMTPERRARSALPSPCPCFSERATKEEGERYGHEDQEGFIERPRNR